MGEEETQAPPGVAGRLQPSLLSLASHGATPRAGMLWKGVHQISRDTVNALLCGLTLDCCWLSLLGDEPWAGYQGGMERGLGATPSCVPQGTPGPVEGFWPVPSSPMPAHSQGTLRHRHRCWPPGCCGTGWDACQGVWRGCAHSPHMKWPHPPGSPVTKGPFLGNHAYEFETKLILL